MKVFLYILAASSDPNNVECLVPYLVNEKEIFFGPCKRLLRQELKDRYLKNSSESILEEEVIIIGFNGSNQEQVRNVVWAGRVGRLLTYETAYMSLIEDDYQLMREKKDSPLHLKPLYDNTGKFQGYEHISLLHNKRDGWVRDLTRIDNPYIKRNDNQLLLMPYADRNQAFHRDCCIVLENIFFANGVGIPISKEIVDILVEVQSDREGISEYAIFGRRVDGSADGRAGRWLEISGDNANKLLDQIKVKSSTIQIKKRSDEIHFKECNCQ